MKPKVHPPLSPTAFEALACYERCLCEREDLTQAFMRDYVSDLRHFIAWYETEREAHLHDCFTPQGITTPTVARYRAYLQTMQRRNLASVNCSLISLKCYFGWALSECSLSYFVKKYAPVAQLPDVIPHDRHHRFDYRVAEAVPLHRLAETIEHDSLDTANFYILRNKA